MEQAAAADRREIEEREREQQVFLSKFNSGIFVINVINNNKKKLLIQAYAALLMKQQEQQRAAKTASSNGRRTTSLVDARDGIDELDASGDTTGVTSATIQFGGNLLADSTKSVAPPPMLKPPPPLSAPPLFAPPVDDQPTSLSTTTTSMGRPSLSRHDSEALRQLNARIVDLKAQLRRVERTRHVVAKQLTATPDDVALKQQLADVRSRSLNSFDVFFILACFIWLFDRLKSSWQTLRLLSRRIGLLCRRELCDSEYTFFSLLN